MRLPPFRSGVFFQALVTVASLSLTDLAIAQENAAAPAAILQVGGDIAKPRSWSAAELAALPHTEVSITEKDGTSAVYSGPSLAAVLQASEAPFGDQLHGSALSLAVAVRASDNYQAIFSLAELDPTLSDKQIILADKLAGKPLPAASGPLRLIIPDAKRHARWVRQVVKLDIVTIQVASRQRRLQRRPGQLISKRVDVGSTQSADACLAAVHRGKISFRVLPLFLCGALALLGSTEYASARDAGFADPKTIGHTRFDKMKEAELLAFIPHAAPIERAEAVAALFVRFAHGRTLGELSKWQGVWQWFPKAGFRCDAVILYDGPEPTVSYHWPPPAFGHIGLEINSQTSLLITLSLRENFGSRFEAILRGRESDQSKSRGLGALCVWQVLGHSCNSFSYDIAPPPEAFGPSGRVH